MAKTLMIQQEEHLLPLLREQKYAKAHAWLNRQKHFSLEGPFAQECIRLGLDATPRLFRKILRCCSPKEYTGQARIQLTDTTCAFVYGTMLTLAAALNRPDHVKVLLEAGYDPNGAGLASAKAVEESDVWWASTANPQLYGDRLAVSGNRVCFSGKARWDIENATPLAAAVACGSREAARALLRCKEVWTAESGPVCRAAVSALQLYADDPRQQVAALVFGNTRNKVFDREFLLKNCDLQMECSVDFCSCDLLETQIVHGFLDLPGAKRALGCIASMFSFGKSRTRARMRKLELLVRQFPEAGQEPWVQGMFLRELVSRYTPEQPHVRLMQRWKALCGGEGDLSWARMELYNKERKQLQSLLKALSADTHLVIDADAMGVFGKESKQKVMDLLTCVQLRHNRGLDGLSALIPSLLEMGGDLRYLRKAAQLGAFAGEDPRELLQYLTKNGRDELRAMVLTFGEWECPETTPAPSWKSAIRKELWHRHWEISDEDYAAWLQELMDADLPEEECLRRIQMMHYAGPAERFWDLDGQIPVQLEGNPHRQEVYVSHPEAAICCAAQIRPLELLLRYLPEKLDRRYNMNFRTRGVQELKGTPLALAAATGRTRVVQRLLDAGFHPDEEGRGTLSALQGYCHDALPLTPVMAAIYYGEADTARQLLDAGAVCDFSQPLFQELLNRGDAQTLAVAESLQGVGFEAVPADLLEELRERFAA